MADEDNTGSMQGRWEQLRQYVPTREKIRRDCQQLYDLLRDVPEENRSEFSGLARMVRNTLWQQGQNLPDSAIASWHYNTNMRAAIFVGTRAGKAAAARRKADELTQIYKLHKYKVKSHKVKISGD